LRAQTQREEEYRLEGCMAHAEHASGAETRVFLLEVIMTFLKDFDFSII
jgi:hypothetical protein